MPVVFTDEAAVGDSSWYEDGKRSKDLADGFVAICKEVGMALPAGVSLSSLSFEVRSTDKECTIFIWHGHGYHRDRNRALSQVGTLKQAITSSA